MQGTAESTLRIPGFDPIIVNYMLDFMYYTRYEPAHNVDLNYALFRSILAKNRAKDDLGANSEMNPTVMLLFIHLEMNSIADYYNVHQLRQAANYEIRKILDDSWEEIVDWYPAFLEATFKKTADVNLHTFLVDISLSHYEELDGVVYGSGVSLDVPASFYSAILGNMKKDLVTAKKKQLNPDMLEKLFQPRNCKICGNYIFGCTINKPRNASLITFATGGRHLQFAWNHDTQTSGISCPKCFREGVL